MKKLLHIIISAAAVLSVTAFTACAASADETSQVSKIKGVLSAFGNYPLASAIAVFSFLMIAILLIFGKNICKFLDKYNSKHMINAFLVFFAVNGLLCLVFALMSDGETWANLMHISKSELLRSQFEDFFRTARSAAQRRYWDIATTTSPLATLVFFVVAQMMPNRYLMETDTMTYYRLIRYQSGMLLYLVIVILAIIAIYKMSRSKLRKNTFTLKDELVAFALVASYPSFYSIELGNIVALSFVLTMFFVFFRDSEKRAVREIADVFLAIAGAFNLFPMIFVFVFFRNKEIKRGIKTFAYFVALYIIPSFITGLGNSWHFVRNFLTIDCNTVVSGNASISNFLLMLGVHNKVIIYAIFVLTELVALCCFFLLKKDWQRAAALVYMIINVPAVSDSTAILFIIIPFVLLLSETEHKGSDWIYLSLFSILITPFAEWFYFDEEKMSAILHSFGLPFTANSNHILALTAVQVLFIVIVCQSVSIIKNKSKSDKVAAVPEKAA